MTFLTGWHLYLKKQRTISNYEFVTLAQIQEWCNIPIQNLFIFENFAQGKVCPGNPIRISDYKSGFTTNYPLTFAVIPRDDLLINLIYDVDCFTTSTIHQLLEQYQQLLESCLLNPDQQVAQLLPRVENDKQIPMHKTGHPLLPGEPVHRPKNSTEQIIARLWLKLIDNKEIIRVDRRDDFFELGGRSIMVAALITKLHEIFNVQLAIHQLVKHSTVASLSDFIQQQPGFINQAATDISISKHDDLSKFSQKNTWSLDKNNKNKAYLSLVPIQPKGSKPPLFCIPAAGNTALGFTGLASRLDPEQPVYGLNPLGLEKNTHPQHTIKEMAELYLDEIQSLQPDGPYYLCGFCYGGIVAYEMAKYLNKERYNVGLLLFIDTGAPVINRLNSGNDATSHHPLRHKQLHRTLQSFISVMVLIPYRKFKEIYKMIFKHDKWKLEKLTQAHLEALTEYRPGTYSGNIVIIRSSEYDGYAKSRKGVWKTSWYDVINGKINYHVIPGLHKELLQGTQLTMLSNIVRSYLSAK